MTEKRNNLLQERLNNESGEESENEESDSEDTVEDSKDTEENSKDSESKSEDKSDTNQMRGGLFSILLPLLAAIVLPALLKR